MIEHMISWWIDKASISCKVVKWCNFNVTHIQVNVCMHALNLILALFSSLNLILQMKLTDIAEPNLNGLMKIHADC